MTEWNDSTDVVDRLKWLVAVRPKSNDRIAMKDAIVVIEELRRVLRGQEPQETEE